MEKIHESKLFQEEANMLVSATEMLNKAKAGHYAVGQFNINNLEWTKAILLTAQEQNSPVILGVSEGAGKYMTGFKTVADMVKAMIDELGITVPVALHLDHGTYEGSKKCIEAGFSSIMFDGSHFEIDENVDAIQKLTGDMPLVLHGGTGIPDDMIKKAISLGVAKINVNTECQLAFADATRMYIEQGKDLEGKGFDPRKLLAPGFEAIKETVKTKMELFGSVGKA